MYLGALELSFDSAKKVVFSKYTLGNKKYKTVNDISGLFPRQPEQYYDNVSAVEIEEYLCSQTSFYFIKGGRSIRITNLK